MDTENEYEDLRELLRKASVRTPPAGLDQRIMREVAVLDGKRRGQRRALVSWLRFVAVGSVVILLASFLGSELSLDLSGKLTAGNIAEVAERSGDAGRWMADHSYYLLPLALLFFRRRMRNQEV
jgi:hypothetical protein